MGAIEKAQARARQAIESRYTGTCKIEGYEKVTNPRTHVTSMQKVTICENQPCRLSIKSLDSTTQTEGASIQTQEIKLFLAPELEVKAGSVITVTQNGRTTEYNKSGVAAVYATHQEIILQLSDEYA